MASAKGSRRSQLLPADFIEEGLRWPDGVIDEDKASAVGVLSTVALLRDGALLVRKVRREKRVSQDAIASRAGVYADTVGRLERGVVWLDVDSLERILYAVNHGLRITKVRDDAEKAPPLPKR